MIEQFFLLIDRTLKVATTPWPRKAKSDGNEGALHNHPTPGPEPHLNMEFSVIDKTHEVLLCLNVIDPQHLSVKIYWVFGNHQ